MMAAFAICIVLNEGYGEPSGKARSNACHLTSAVSCLAPSSRSEAGRLVPARRRTGFDSGNTHSYSWEQNGIGAITWDLSPDTAEQDRRIFRRGSLRPSPGDTRRDPWSNSRDYLFGRVAGSLWICLYTKILSDVRHPTT